MPENRFYSRVNLFEGTLTRLGEAEFRAVLQRLPQFRSNYLYHLETVVPRCTRPLCTSVTIERVRRGMTLIEKYLERGLTPFVPVAVNYRRFRQIILPPIIQRRQAESEAIVLDGMHRIWAAQSLCLESIEVLVITGPMADFSWMPLDWEHVDIVDSDPPIADKFLAYAPEQYDKLYTITLNGEWLWTEQEDS